MESQDHNSWKELAEQKEKEWKQFTQLRLESLETSCKQKDTNLNEEKKKFDKLKDDFKYNLKLLQERDQELERYDAVFTDYKTQLNSRNSELSESKILLDELRTRIRQEEKSREELQLHYQHRLKEKQQEIDTFRSNKDLEVSEERKHFEEFKRNLQEKLKEVEGELDAQKRELNSGFEEAMKKKEHEFRLKVDEMSVKVLEYELKAKILSKELEFLKANQKQVTAEFNESEYTTRQVEKKLKEKEWEITDNKAMADAKINEMDIEMKQLESSMRRAEEDYQRKYSEMDKCLREREEALSKIKDSYLEREQTLTNTIRDLQTKLETGEIDIRQLQWTNTDLNKEKDIQTIKLKEELKELQDKWDKSIADMSRSQVSRDLEVHCLRENDSKLKAEILQKKQDIERYKKELTLAAEREAALERSKTQLELDWQNRYEDTERVQYEKSEDFIKKVIAARDEAIATVKEKTRTLEEQERLLKIVERDRDIVMATLKKHGIPLDKSVVAHIESANSEDVKKIQEQNRNLRHVISQMRQQMESIGQSSAGQSSAGHSSLPNSLVNADNDYIDSLENEIKSLKEKMRQLESKEDQKPVSDIDKDIIPSEIKDNIIVRDHIVSLNEQIGILKSEKTELNAQYRKLQARLHYIETSTDKLSQEPRQKQIEIDQLNYQLNTTKRRHEAETASFKQRLSELELQLIETRKEADEYYRGSLERNMEVTALGNQLSALKMEMAESRPAINLGAQELLIQQLQDEIMRLKHQSSEMNIDNLNLVDNLNASDGKPSTAVIQDLQSKLKKAVRHIATLAKEKQQLIEVGNRLGGELKKAGINSAPNQTSFLTNQHISTAVNPTVISHHSTSAPSHQHLNTQRQQLSQDFITRLSQLEKLQYQLTKQELQYAQKFSPQKVEDVGQSDLRPIKDSSSTLAASKSREILSTGNSLNDPVLMSMSSVGGDSIQEVWKMLDGQGSPSLITPRTLPHSNKSKGIERQDNNKIQIEGQKTSLQTKDNKRPQSATSKNTKLKLNKKPQARNYNMKEDRNK